MNWGRTCPAILLFVSRSVRALSWVHVSQAGEQMLKGGQFSSRLRVGQKLSGKKVRDRRICSRWRSFGKSAISRRGFGNASLNAIDATPIFLPSSLLRSWSLVPHTYRSSCILEHEILVARGPDCGFHYGARSKTHQHARACSIAPCIGRPRSVANSGRGDVSNLYNVRTFSLTFG